MALTVGKTIDFENGSLTADSISTSGSPVVTTSAPVHGGSYSLKCPGNATLAQYRFTPFAPSSGGTDFIVGFWFYTNNVAPAAARNFLSAVSGGNPYIRLRLGTDGKINIIGAANDVTAVGTSTNVLTANTWHFIELYWQDLDSGVATLFVDNTQWLTVSAKDFHSAATNFDAATFPQYRFDGGNASGEDFTFDDVYCLSGATSAADRIGIPTAVAAFLTGAALGVGLFQPDRGVAYGKF